MIDISVDQEMDSKNISIAGSLTVEHAAQMMETLRNALTMPIPNVRLTLGPVTKIDVTFFQLLCSAHRRATDCGKTFVVENFHQEPITRALRLMGFNRNKGCSCDAAQSCVLARMSA